ncbi:MAG: response regulator, partial [Aliifodinibius sp.]|nr:response regulator [Fodinibius sp.]NIV12502.1 response regulator [Fodinibius sp.]NIY27113.1 response regulator [Fodinibius sp.]
SHNKNNYSPTTIRILIVEDNPGDVRLLKELLTNGDLYKFELVHKENLKEGLEYLSERKTDVILLDLSLP